MPAGSYLWYAGGLVLGIVLGLIAMRTVRYENRGGIWHYRMNLWIGAIVTLLFVGRVLVDFSGDQALISSSAAGAAPVQPNIASDGSSLGLYALVFSYYAYTGVVLYLKARSLARESQVSGEV